MLSQIHGYLLNSIGANELKLSQKVLILKILLHYLKFVSKLFLYMQGNISKSNSKLTVFHETNTALHFIPRKVLTLLNGGKCNQTSITQKWVNFQLFLSSKIVFITVCYQFYRIVIYIMGRLPNGG